MTNKSKRKHEALTEEEVQLLRIMEMVIDDALARGSKHITIEVRDHRDTDGDTP
jgi:hypothetical protein